MLKPRCHVVMFPGSLNFKSLSTLVQDIKFVILVFLLDRGMKLKS